MRTWLKNSLKPNERLETGRTAPAVAQIEEAVLDIPGWTPLDQLYSLFLGVCLTAPLGGDVIELGSWCGRSAVVLALAARLTGKCKVVCVDLFPSRDDWKQNADGSYSFKVTLDGVDYRGYEDQTVWQEPFERDLAPLYREHENLADVFRDTVSRKGFSDIVTSIRGTSDFLVRSLAPDFRCRLAFVDGDHSYDAVCRDIGNISRYLVPGGLIFFDDAFSYYDGVNRAIQDRIIASPDFDLAQQVTRKCFLARKRPLA